MTRDTFHLVADQQIGLDCATQTTVGCGGIKQVAVSRSKRYAPREAGEDRSEGSYAFPVRDLPEGRRVRAGVPLGGSTTRSEGADDRLGESKTSLPEPGDTIESL